MNSIGMRFRALACYLVLTVGFFACAYSVAHAAEAVLQASFSPAQANKTSKVQVEALTPMALAKALSQWTGLDFALVGAKVQGKTVTVDWSPKSTLIANMGDTPQKEEFHFFDADSMRIFMLDSLAATLRANLGVDAVFYTMDGGKGFHIKELSYPEGVTFTSNGFYLHEANKEQQAQKALLALVAGRWKSLNPNNGEPMYLAIGNTGAIKRYTADNVLYDTGLLVVNDEYGDGAVMSYTIRNAANEAVAGFYLDHATQLHFGNDSGYEYERMLSE